jgi:hypothetical protein
MKSNSKIKRDVGLYLAAKSEKSRYYDLEIAVRKLTFNSGSVK